MSGLPIPFPCPGCGAVLGRSDAELLILSDGTRHTSIYSGHHRCSPSRLTEIRWHPTPGRRRADGVAVVEALACPTR